METFSKMIFNEHAPNVESLDSKAAFFMSLEAVFTMGCRLARDFGRICQIYIYTL